METDPKDQGQAWVDQRGPASTELPETGLLRSLCLAIVRVAHPSPALVNKEAVSSSRRRCTVSPEPDRGVEQLYRKSSHVQVGDAISQGRTGPKSWRVQISTVAWVDPWNRTGVRDLLPMNNCCLTRQARAWIGGGVVVFKSCWFSCNRKSERAHVSVESS
jgi:arginine deiminase